MPNLCLLDYKTQLEPISTKIAASPLRNNRVLNSRPIHGVHQWMSIQIGIGSSGSVLLRRINFRPWPAPHSCVGHYKRGLDNYGALLNELGPSEESAALHNRAASIRQRREHP
jgi:hypothetical protein